MTKLWQQIIKGEKGQALPIVLILLVLGGLLVVPSLDYAATSLNASRIVKQDLNRVYAADAGVEHVLWQIINGELEEVQTLPENVNRLEVTVETEEEGYYSLYHGELFNIQDNHDYLAVYREMVWEELADAYKYTITVIWQPRKGDPTIHLLEVGAKLAAGYSYQSGSAAGLSEDPPDDTLDGAGAHMLNWDLGSPPPTLSEAGQMATQTFYFSGIGELGDDYAWVKASPTSIGVTGDTAGTLYSITATATGDSGSTIVEAYVLARSDDATTPGGNFTLGPGDAYNGNVYVEENVQLLQDAIIDGSVSAGENVHLNEGAMINGTVCAEGDVQLDQGAIINGNVYAEGDVQLGEDAIINGNVYAEEENVERGEGAIIAGAIYPYEGCGLSLTGTRLEILNWEVD